MEARKNNDKKKSTINNFAKYSGLGFEMLGIIFLGTFAGVKLDEKRAGEFQIFTVVFSLLSVLLALYLVLRNFIQPKK